MGSIRLFHLLCHVITTVLICVSGVTVQAAILSTRSVLALDTSMEETLDYQSAKYIVKYYKFEDPEVALRYDLPPLVLKHGLASNSTEFVSLIRELVAMGFRVYTINWPGFGQGPMALDSHRSYVQHYQRGDYDFHNMAKLVNPAIDRKIHELEGERPVVIGHSMGAMIPYVSASLGLGTEHVRDLVMLGGPVDFSKMKKIRFFAKPLRLALESIHRVGDPAKPLMIPKVENLIMRALIHQGVEKIHASELAHWTLGWFGKLKHFDSYELGRLAITGGSGVHVDMLKSFLDFVEHGFPYQNLPFPHRIGLLGVYGEKDWMAHPDPIVDNLYRIWQNDHSNTTWILGLRGVGHFDEIAEKVVRPLAQELRHFVKRTGGYNDHGVHRIISPVVSKPEVINPILCQIVFY